MKAAAAIVLLLAPPARAAFQETPTSIKAEAMGGAFAGLADDASALLVNPAGLAVLARPEAAMMYGTPLAGIEGLELRKGYGAIGVPLGGGAAAALGGTFFQAAGLLSEYQGLAGAGMRLGDKFAAGAALTYLHHSYDIGKDPAHAREPVFAGGLSRGALGADIGALAFVAPNVRFGASVRNINEPDVGLSQLDRVPREVRFGGLLRTRWASLLADIKQRGGSRSREGGSTWHIGAQIPIRVLALRIGANNAALTAGLGVELGFARLDYAFHLLRRVEASNNGAQIAAVSFPLGAGWP